MFCNQFNHVRWRCRYHPGYWCRPTDVMVFGAQPRFQENVVKQVFSLSETFLMYYHCFTHVDSLTILRSALRMLFGQCSLFPSYSEQDVLLLHAFWYVLVLPPQTSSRCNFVTLPRYNTIFINITLTGQLVGCALRVHHHHNHPKTPLHFPHHWNNPCQIHQQAFDCASFHPRSRSH